MKVLITIISYQGDADNGNHDKIRETWGKDCAAAGADLKFFVGRRLMDRHGNSLYLPKSDEVLIPWQTSRSCQHDWWSSVEGCCEDFWQPLTKNTLRWSLDNGYDYTFLCENDTFLIPSRLMKSGYESCDLMGQFVQGAYDFSWPDPGVGYFLSRKGAYFLIHSQPDHWSIGMYTGYALKPYIERGDLESKSLPTGISWHFRLETGNGYPPRSPWMKQMYEMHKEK